MTGKIASRPKAYALVDAKTRTIRMDADDKSLAIFDTRAGARDATKSHPGTRVVAIFLERAV